MICCALNLIEVPHKVFEFTFNRFLIFYDYYIVVRRVRRRIIRRVLSTTQFYLLKTCRYLLLTHFRVDFFSLYKNFYSTSYVKRRSNVLIVRFMFIYQKITGIELEILHLNQRRVLENNMSFTLVTNSKIMYNFITQTLMFDFTFQYDGHWLIVILH